MTFVNIELIFRSKNDDYGRSKTEKKGIFQEKQKLGMFRTFIHFTNKTNKLT